MPLLIRDGESVEITAIQVVFQRLCCSQCTKSRSTKFYCAGGTYCQVKHWKDHKTKFNLFSDWASLCLCTLLLLRLILRFDIFACNKAQGLLEEILPSDARPPTSLCSQTD